MTSLLLAALVSASAHAINLSAPKVLTGAPAAVNLSIAAPQVTNIPALGAGLQIPALNPQTALSVPQAAISVEPTAQDAQLQLPFPAAEPLSAQAAAPQNAAQAAPAEQAEAGQVMFDGVKRSKPYKGVSMAWIENMRGQEKEADAQARRLRDVVQRVGFSQTALNREIIEQHNNNYTVEIARGPITNQKSSGRCWIFAGLNMVRSMMLADEKVTANEAQAKSLELSENYLHFFNMLEKSNTELQLVIEKAYKKHPKSERWDENKRRAALTPQVGDGGWYDWFAFLVGKYGLVPKSAMGETISSEATAALLGEINNSLAATAAEMAENARLYKAKKQPNRSAEIRDRGMQRVWRILVTHLGEPPAAIDHRENAKQEIAKGVAKTPATVTRMTPQEYAKNVAKFDPKDYVVVSSYPNKKEETLYEIKKSAIGDAEPGQPKQDLRFLNVSPERMEALTAEAIKGGQPVWFAADIGKDVDHKTGIMHPRIFDREAVYDFPKGAQGRRLTRKEKVYFSRLAPTHAMLLTGLDQPDPAKPVVKYKDENSWGEDLGTKGVYHLYREWFLDNVFEVVVHRRFLSDAERAVVSGKPVQTKRKT